ncbi:RNA polymerase sigma factor [Neolewinella aurantiaca]|uniref:RNA polymerase sigma factor n=1 Tax=Neolewinella aurantiaca TaxID=2602767 RepID=A0A5C7FM85_9BACT|nr:RNA polymerase sigma factor [Neolewinella aurantiaca]TXF87079.1 RNA polymerase sigma factor [Neolewinella aurantiaca]
MIPTTDEATLLGELNDPRQRDAAFRKLVAAYGPALHRHLLRMLHSGADTDDVLQNTLVKAYRNLKKFRGDSKLSTWLYRIATNEALSWLRSSQRRNARFSSEEPGSIADRQLEADAYFDGDEAQAHLHRALATLPAKQRAVFSFRYFDDLPYRQIAEITGTSEGALKASYHLAVKKIESQLKAYVQ